MQVYASHHHSHGCVCKVDGYCNHPIPTDSVSLVALMIAVLLPPWVTPPCSSMSLTRHMLMPRVHTALMDHQLGSTGAKATRPRNGPFTCKVWYAQCTSAQMHNTCTFKCPFSMKSALSEFATYIRTTTNSASVCELILCICNLVDN